MYRAERHPWSTKKTLCGEARYWAVAEDGPRNGSSRRRPKERLKKKTARKRRGVSRKISANNVVTGNSCRERGLERRPSTKKGEKQKKVQGKGGKRGQDGLVAPNDVFTRNLRGRGGKKRNPTFGTPAESAQKVPLGYKMSSEKSKRPSSAVKKVCRPMSLVGSFSKTEPIRAG